MKIIVAPDYVEFSGWFHDIIQNFYEKEGEVLWNGRNVIKRFEIDGKSFVVKKYKRANLVQRVVYTLFKKSKARRAFEFAEEYRRLGIDTPRQVAYVEQKEAGFFTIGYFIAENCAKPGLLELLPRDSDGEDEFDNDAARAIAAEICKLHRMGVVHGDLNLSNFLYERDEKGEFHFTLIDINRTKFYTPNRKQCAVNLARVTHNREQLEFIVREYCAIRKWEFEPFYAEVYATLRHRERQKSFKRFIRNGFKH